jgi:hypothetical protein
MVWSAVKGSICLGRSDVDIGHKRVPDPPDRITGTIGDMRAVSFADGDGPPVRGAADVR